jgi:Resolvase, N terminal domain
VPPKPGCPAVSVRDAPDERQTHDRPDVFVRDNHQHGFQSETDVRNPLAEERPGELVELRLRGRQQFDAIGIQAIDSNRESLDRFSRDQEDTAGLFKRLTFAGVNIVTLAEGDITHLHIGFKGTMNALFLKDLAEKTHRGLRGRVESGKADGGLCYGYRVVKSLAGGTLTTGEREIEPGEAAIVDRIFREYVAGKRSSRVLPLRM